MSRFLGDALPDLLLRRLGVEQAIERADRAMIICTVDEQGWPHPAMVSSLELVAVDARNVRVAVHAGSRTATHMRANGRLTVILVDEGLVHYLKGDVRLLAPSLTAAPELAAFNLRVDSVLEDIAPDDEYAKIVTGIRLEPRQAPTGAEIVLREMMQE